MISAWSAFQESQQAYIFSKSARETLEKKCEICSKLTKKTPNDVNDRLKVENHLKDNLGYAYFTGVLFLF